MKKISIFLLLASLSGCFGKRPVVTTGHEGKPMPSFNLLLMDSSTRFNTNSIPKGEPIVLFYFSPFCPYCKAQTTNIIKQVATTEGIRFYFLSNFSFSPVKAYYQNYSLNKSSNITVGMDYDNFFGPYFNAQAVPYLAIYDADKKLKKVLIGNVGASVIREIAFE